MKNSPARDEVEDADDLGGILVLVDAREVGFEAAPDRRCPHHFHDVDRIAETLQGARAERAERMAAVRGREMGGHRRAQHLLGLRLGAEPGRFDHGNAEVVAVLLAHLTHAHADAYRCAVGPGVRRRLHRLLQRDRAVDRGADRRERGHHAVAEPLHLFAVELGEHGRDEIEVIGEQRLRPRRTEAGAQAGGVDEVGEHDRGCRDRCHPYLPAVRAS